MEHAPEMPKFTIALRGMAVLLILVLAGCGPSSGNEQPTATSDTASVAAPTLPALQASPAPVNTTPIKVITPTPLPLAPSTPVDTEVDSATPDVVSTVVSIATPETTGRVRTGRETFDNPGDGTGGSGMPGERSSNVPDESSSTTVPTLATGPVLKVAGCDVPDVPVFRGDSPFFILTGDLNFRSGPGAQCDPLSDEPLGEGQVVEVIGGPVMQSSDESEWVQIRIDDETGWIITEFLEPENP